MTESSPTAPVFDVARLRFDITTIWGEHGAHADLFDQLARDAQKAARYRKVAYEHRDGIAIARGDIEAGYVGDIEAALVAIDNAMRDDDDR